jgi:glycerol-3-phosphate acyltransferase PlsX
MEDKPSQALRSGRGSSMRLAIDAVHNGEANAVVSAGNTGALMAMAKFVLKTLPGIDRPAIASFFPTLRSESVMLDLGANVQCDADNLVQFAVMGNVFARTVLGVREPSMGLLNVGSEELKGHDAVKVASGILRQATLPGKFLGFVEGDDITRGTCDVIVTDGFTGNVALKSIEGAVKLYSHFLRQTFKSSWIAGIGYLLARPAMNALRARVDPRRYNGAIFMGLNGVCVKSHGGTDAFGFANAIGVAVDMVTNGAIEKMREDFALLHTQANPQAAAL